jgi:hypothetical protein
MHITYQPTRNTIHLQSWVDSLSLCQNSFQWLHPVEAPGISSSQTLSAVVYCRRGRKASTYLTEVCMSSRQKYVDRGVFHHAAAARGVCAPQREIRQKPSRIRDLMPACRQVRANMRGGDQIQIMEMGSPHPRRDGHPDVCTFFESVPVGADVIRRIEGEPVRNQVLP